MIKKIKGLKPSFLLGVLFSILSVFFLCSIIYWYFNGENTDKLLQGINDKEVVGIEVPAPIPNANPIKEKLFPFVPVKFEDLKNRNDETVAWLKMDSVNINIPIVQTVDNEYYLTHDIDKKSNALGWVFADVRSNMEYLGTNTVLYGHNASNKQMFGSLKDIFKTDPEKKSVNEIIQLTTPSKQMVFEITSVYVTTFEDWKYVQPTFADDDAKRAFIERMQEKNSMAIFNRTDLSIHDQFLTFSTCYGAAGTEDRLVVHARLIAEQPNT